MSRTPPARDRASPIELTDTSILVPGRENDGNAAVTMTALVLRTRTSVGFTRIPMRPNMPLMDCAVKVTWVLSPVFASPTTKP